MKKLFIGLIISAALQAKSQLLVNLQLPPNGVMQKSQLWNMTVTNTGTMPLSVHIEIMFTDLQNSMQVMSGATQVITIAPGTMQLNNSLLQPIQYNILSLAYNVDASPNGLLPVGDFEVCYSFMSHRLDGVEKIAEECDELIIEPLSPPQLVYPYDQSIIETKNPQFSWLPPMAISLFTNLDYDLDLVELYPNQSADDAIQQNIAILHQLGIASTSFQYNAGFPSLQLDKQYAWRIIAKSNGVSVGQSETWTFSIKEFNRVDTLEESELPFAKLQKDGGVGYAIFTNELKFDYLNENADSTWDLSIVDLSKAEKKQVTLSMDTISLRAGQNLIKYDVSHHPDFMDKHLYLMEIINSRNESWKLRFEIRKPEE